MDDTYVDIMVQSLRKKVQVLDCIIECNLRQKAGLENSLFTVEEFDAIVEEKDALIEQLLQLDGGFEKLFERMKQELESNREEYAQVIKQMKELIQKVTDQSMEIQVQEARNKELMTKKFAYVKDQARNVRVGVKALEQYRQNMNGSHQFDPQFWDNKN